MANEGNIKGKSEPEAALTAPLGIPEKPKRERRVLKKEPAPGKPVEPIKQVLFEEVGTISSTMGKPSRVVRDPANGCLYRLIQL